MGKVRGRLSRQPKSEQSSDSYVSESENDTFLTAKNQSLFLSVCSPADATYTAEDLKKDDLDSEETLLEENNAAPLSEDIKNRRITRSTAKRSRKSRSVLNIDRTPKDNLKIGSRSMRKTKSRKSAPGVIAQSYNMKRKLSDSSVDESALKVLESTPTDNFAAKRKLAGSEPARKQLLLNLSPIETTAHKQAHKPANSDAPSSSKLDAATIANDTVCLSTEKITQEPTTKVQPLASSSTSRLNNQTSSSFRKPAALQSKPSLSRKLTIPTSPKFTTIQRRYGKAIDYTPYKEKETKLADQMKSYRFRAQPIPKNVLKPAASVQPKSDKQAQRPTIKQTKSVQPGVAPMTKKVQPKQGAPVNNKNDAAKKKPFGITGGGIQKKRATEARTPTFMASKRINQKSEFKKMIEDANRAKEAQKKEAEKLKHQKFMERALRGTSKPKAVASSSVAEKATKPVPFSFLERDAERKLKKEQKIQEFLEEEKRKREFHAQPLPNLQSVSGLPPKEMKEITRPEPFNLATGAPFNSTWSTTVDSDLLQLDFEDQYQFRARPMPDMSIPFVPERSQRESTEPLPIVLHTAVRADERKPFDDYLKAREKELEEAKRQREEAMAEEEKREVAHLRKSMVPKAQPVRQYKPTIIEYNKVPPTVPESPALATRSRAKARALAVAEKIEEEEYEDELLNASGDTYVVDI